MNRQTREALQALRDEIGASHCDDRLHRKRWAASIDQALAEPDAVEATPAARWRTDGEPDPHGNRYDCEREALTLGKLTDDELANAVFMHGGEPLNIAAVMAGEPSPHCYLVAAKDRIRWLSRKVAAPPAVKVPPLNEELTWILGRPNFTVSRYARKLHNLGLYDVESRSENEQAAAIHWMLNLYLIHGEKWRDEADRILFPKSETAAPPERDQKGGPA